MSDFIFVSFHFAQYVCTCTSSKPLNAYKTSFPYSLCPRAYVKWWIAWQLQALKDSSLMKSARTTSNKEQNWNLISRTWREMSERTAHSRWSTFNWVILVSRMSIDYLWHLLTLLPLTGTPYRECIYSCTCNYVLIYECLASGLFKMWNG